VSRTGAGAARHGPVPVLAIVGPTGVGKTAVAVGLARDCPIEAISMDSRQVYRQLDRGTGKPTATERRLLRHHVIDVVDPDERYDAARFARDATRAITDIRSRGRWPVLVGGTGLYLRALVRGLSPLPPADPALRARLRQVAATGGPAALHARLRARDATAAARLHPRDVVRVIRAIEVVETTGQALSETRAAHAHRGDGPAHRVLAVGLTAPREVLYPWLDRRVDEMVAADLLGEVAGLLARGYGLDLASMQGIGYRHLVPVVAGQGSLETAVRAMKRDTRRYAKRQWTWFAREEVAEWITVEPGEVTSAVERVKKLLELTRFFV
jgi:tRNA dimethylallyltransferase